MCKLTKIVFEMESEGEVKYRIISWDNKLLNNLPQKEPAGPLYNIDGPEGSVRRLHFPHCEIGKGKEKLTVAHVADGKVEIIQPQTVTDTHVIINIQSLSPFGLIFPRSETSIRAQVLLFYKKKTEHCKSKLNIHLLPANVPVKEVQKQHKSYTYIDTTSTCDLTPRRKYRLRYTNTVNTDNTVLQPKVVKFQRDCGPNYHPTFEILNIEAAEVTLILSEKKGKEVWTRFVDLITEPNSTIPDIAGADFVDEHRETLIQRFPSVMEFADCLIGKNMISTEMYENIKAKSTPQDKMRELYTCLDSVGRAAKQEFHNILEMNYSCLVSELGELSVHLVNT
ncbi:NACHT, LRR and PYD domains-containing protein 1b allele 2-like [Hemibagrus wyckioides]|nr:NACHT, LRR and PYD domains-containing protein 1b allele 2-like [Hemibagrus wyckioides]XP_058239089.1 NACHT, LRR and PYD domains-containing protein 1b allele 2-like [Hemibagrus wyckioides]